MNKLIKIARKIVDGEDYSKYNKSFGNGFNKVNVIFHIDDQGQLYARIQFSNIDSDFAEFACSLTDKNIDNNIYHVQQFLKSLKEANEYVKQILR